MYKRQADDPPPGTRESFTALLDSSLPTKRAIAQGVLRAGPADGAPDEASRVLLCELVYKREWDLPGGVVDRGESPAECVVREVREELALDVTVRSLLAVNWLPPFLGWGDATVFVFDLGVVDPRFTDAARLEAREIQAVHWATPHEWPARVAPYNARLLDALLRCSGDAGTLYLEDGVTAARG